jgi:hypothetical protein
MNITAAHVYQDLMVHVVSQHVMVLMEQAMPYTNRWNSVKIQKYISGCCFMPSE